METLPRSRTTESDILGASGPAAAPLGKRNGPLSNYESLVGSRTSGLFPKLITEVTGRVGAPEGMTPQQLLIAPSYLSKGSSTSSRPRQPVRCSEREAGDLEVPALNFRSRLDSQTLDSGHGVRVRQVGFRRLGKTEILR